MSKSRKDRSSWLDEPRNVTRLYRGLLVVCALLLLADLFYDKHTHFAFESWFGFFGVFGFVAFVFAVMAGKQLRRIVGRKEDYYDE